MRLSVLAAGLLMAAGQVALAAPPTTIQDPTNVNRNMAVNSDGSINVNATVAVSGFTPNGNVASLAVSNASANVALPAGTVVAVANTGATDASIKLSVGAGTAATTDFILKAGATVGLTVGSNTFINAITAASTTTLSLAGGTGLVSGYGGGGSGGGAVTVASGADVVEGASNDSAGCASGSAKTIAGCMAQIHADAIASTPAGSAIIGKVGVDQTTPGTTNAVQAIAGTTGGVTPFTLTAANSTNATNIKASAGTLYHVGVYNNSATLAWVSFYNTAGTPSCGTSIVYQTMIPANSTSGAGAVEDFATGMAFGTGIGICITTGIAGTGSVAASAYVVGLGYK
jgi:hypothetical protein